jgi:ribosome-binding factor A
MARDRPARVAAEFQHEVSSIIARGLKDPRITGFVTVTGAKMSPDLKEVAIYVSVHGDDKVRRDTFAGLQAATGYIQREAARTPRMSIVYDGSVEEGDKIERLLKEARAKDGR